MKSPLGVVVIYLVASSLVLTQVAGQAEGLQDLESKFNSYFAKDTKHTKKNSQYQSEDKELQLDDEELKEAKSPIIFPKWTCKEQTTASAISDDEMTNHNYMKILYRYKTFLLWVVASWCDYCCQHNYELEKLKDMLRGKTFEDEDIPIVMLNSDKAGDALKELKVPFFKVPSLYLVKDKFFWQYNSFFKAPNILRFVNNIFHPVITLTSVKQVEEFFDMDKPLKEPDNDFLAGQAIEIEELYEYAYKNRLIGFFSDKDEYSAEYDDFFKHAQKISYRSDLRLAVVTDKEIIRHFKQIYEGTWFNSHSWNSVVLKRDEKFMFLDLSLMNEHLEIFLIYNTISYVDELCSNNTKLTSQISTPVMLFFIDTTFIMDNFYTMFRFMEYLSKEYIGKVVFMFMDGNTKTKAKEVLGLKKDMPIPNFVLNYLQVNKQKHAPETFPFCDKFIKKFLARHLTGHTKGYLDDIREKNIRSFDDKIVKNLRLATKLNMENMEKILASKKYDILLFVVDTDYDQKTESLARFINKLGERLKALGIKSLLISVFDVNENGSNARYKNVTFQVGKIIMVTSNSKKVVPFDDKVSTLRLMKFAEKNSEIKFRLPDLPHIELDLHESYYEKKSLLETYEENFDKDEFQLDDIIGMDFEVSPFDEEQLKDDL